MDVRIENASFNYEGTDEAGANNIDITIKQGECILLCGRSGCGKTTITRMVNGLIPLFYQGDMTGEVILGPRNLKEMKMYEISQYVGSVFQNPRTQFFNVDTDSEIAFGIENQGIPYNQLKERFDNTIARLDIEKLCGRNIFHLSGGEKQKIAFASIFAMNPDVYILDEPSSNLDLEAIKELKKYLMLIKSIGKTILIAEHRIYYLMGLADRIVYMDNGEIKRIFEAEEFRRITDAKRIKLGLRALDINKVEPVDEAAKGDEAKPVLEIKSVSLFHKKNRILGNINCSAGQGEIIAITGRNGVGKTTFVRYLCGLHKESEGIYEWKGKPQSPKSRMKLSYMVMQDVNYELFAQSVMDECTLGIKNADINTINTTLEKLGLKGLENRHPNTLSGGQKQRLAIAVGLICNKELLVFDEPTSGLDYDGMSKVVGLIRSMAANKLIFVVTHDYEFICSACTRMIYFSDGTMLDDIKVTNDNRVRIKELLGVQR